MPRVNTLYDVRQDVANLVEAHEGKSFTELWAALVVAAVAADNGSLVDSSGKKGFAWNPKTYEYRHTDSVKARLAAAASSLGRMLFMGRADYRTIAAFTEACYQVTVESEYDVAARIEELWDQTTDRDEIPTVVIPMRRPGLFKRALIWLRRIFHSNPSVA